MTSPNEQSPITWQINRTPDYELRNNFLPDSLTYRIDLNIYENNRNSYWINDPYDNHLATSGIRTRRSNNQQNLINNNPILGAIARIMALQNQAEEDEDEDEHNDDFIPFDNNYRQNSIDVNIEIFDTTEEDGQCCICLEEMGTDNICRLNCQHTFCIQCTNQHLQRNHTCPLCRSDITTVSVQSESSRNRFNL